MIFTASTVLALSAFVLPALADPTPSEPAPGRIFNEGSKCQISWEPDTTGQWTTMNIELMSGSNFNMTHLTTVAKVDGTSTTTTSFSYDCPAVTIHSAIYFYQFSSPAAPTNLTWTGRFAIADSTGATTTPPNATQPNGDAKPWGQGALVDPSTAVAAPSYLASTTSSGGSVSVSVSGTDGSSGTSSATYSVPTRNVAPPGGDSSSDSGASSTDGSASQTSSSVTPSQSVNSGALKIQNSVYSAGVGLMAAAAVFVVAL